jgi:hypothetical protein
VTRPPAAGARALVVGLLAPTLGVLAHVGAGGMLPHDAPVLGAMAVLVGAGAALLVRRRTGLVRIVAALGGGQVAWHLALAGVGSSTPDMIGMGGAVGVDGMIDMAGIGTSAAVGMAGMAVPGPAMVGAHAVTTLVVALGVVGVETAVALLVAGGIVVHGALRRLGTRPSPPRAAPRARAPRFRRVPPRPAPLRHAPALRGPPVCA